MSRSFVAIVGGWILMLGVPAMAQDVVLGQMYGNGVHAFFSQDYVHAHEYFTSAIDGRSQDPRCFYFRGLTYNKLGRPQEAESDFKEGAKLEASVDAARSYGVARALERIQGADRAQLEMYRLEARAAVLKKIENDDRVRYGTQRKEMQKFLEVQASGAPAEVNKPGDSVKPTDPLNPGAPPPTVDAKKPADKPIDPPIVEKAAEPTPPTMVEEKKADAKEKTDDPFGAAAKPAGKATDKSAPDKSAKPADDSTNPFQEEGGDKADKKDAPANPADTKKESKTDDADPFGK